MELYVVYNSKYECDTLHSVQKKKDYIVGKRKPVITVPVKGHSYKRNPISPQYALQRVEKWRIFMRGLPQL